MLIAGKITEVILFVPAVLILEICLYYPHIAERKRCGNFLYLEMFQGELL